jgi:hypothetical protein
VRLTDEMAESNLEQSKLDALIALGVVRSPTPCFGDRGERDDR